MRKEEDVWFASVLTCGKTPSSPSLFLSYLSHQIKYVETSAKLNINVQEVFYSLVREIERKQSLKGEMLKGTITDLIVIARHYLFL